MKKVITLVLCLLTNVCSGIGLPTLLPNSFLRSEAGRIVSAGIDASFLTLLSQSLTTTKPALIKAAGITSAPLLSLGPIKRALTGRLDELALGVTHLIIFAIPTAIIASRYARHAKLLANWRKSWTKKAHKMWARRVKNLLIMNVVGSTANHIARERQVALLELFQHHVNNNNINHITREQTQAVLIGYAGHAGLFMNIVNFFRILHFMRTQVRDALRWQKKQRKKAKQYGLVSKQHQTAALDEDELDALEEELKNFEKGL